MNIHEHLAKFLHLMNAGRCIVDETTALARCCEFATYYAVIGVEVNFILIKPFLHVVCREIEMCFDTAFLGTGLDCLCVGTLSHEQSDGTKHDTLTCTRLTCNDRET